MKRWLLVVALVGAGCSSSGESVAPPTTVTPATTAPSTSTTAAPSTTSTTVETTTTLSETEIAEMEIEAVIEAWYEGEVDSTLGEPGYNLELLVDPIRQRVLDAYSARAENGQMFVSLDSAEVDVLEIQRQGQAAATATACARGGSRITDIATGDLIAEDDGRAFIGVFELLRVDGDWYVSDYFSGRVNGGAECDPEP